MDHHCVFLDSCVGEQNVKNFLAFLIQGFIGITSFLIIVILRLAKVKKSSSENNSSFGNFSFFLFFLDVLKGKIFLIEILLIGLFILFFVSALLINQIYLVSKGRTMIEDLIPGGLERNGKGSCVKNWKEFLGGVNIFSIYIGR